jgi:hypothetical protein
LDFDRSTNAVRLLFFPAAFGIEKIPLDVCCDVMDVEAEVDSRGAGTDLSDELGN